MKRLSLGLLLLSLATSAFAAGVEWTSATAQNAVLSIPLAKGSTVAVTFNPNGSITGGVLTFEAIDDNSQAYPISLARVDTLAVEGTFALNAAAKQAWQGRLTGFTSFQVRLSTVITGTGTANLTAIVSPIASGGPVAVLGTVTTTPPANASINLNQVGGSAVATGTGIGGAGIPRVTVSTDSQFRVWDGTTAASVIAATNALKSDLSSVAGTATVTGGVAGSQGVGGLAANNAAVAGNPNYIAGFSWTDGTSPTATTAGNVTALMTTTDHRLVMTSDHPKRFMCSAFNNAATILTAFGSPCSAPGAGLSLYVTDINFSASVISTTTADQYPELKYGTGGTCGTGTTVLWAQYGTAFGSNIAQFITPLKVPANNELCWMHAATGSKSVTISGYIAP